MLGLLLIGLFIRLQRTSGIRDMRVARRRFWKKDSTLCFIRIISSSASGIALSMRSTEMTWPRFELLSSTI